VTQGERLRGSRGLLLLLSSLGVSGCGRLVEEAPAAGRETAIDRAGTLDPSFGVAGTFTLALSKYDRDGFQAVVAAPDGSIFAAGGEHTISGSFFLAAHVRADGSADPAWGDGGGALRITLPDGSRSAVAFAIGRQSTGSVVLAGADRRRGEHAAVAAALPDGRPDPAFGATGSRVLALEGDAAALALAVGPDDGIVVAGHHGQRALVVRLAPDGEPDASFAQGGHADLDPIPGAAAQAHGVALDAAGGILVAGEAGSQAFLVRLSADGREDPSFRAGGAGPLPAPDGADVAVAQRIALQPDGAILVGGYARGGGVSSVAVWRLLPDGAPDPRFGARGRVVVPVPGAVDPLAGFTVFADGRIVVAVDADTEARGAPARETVNATPLLLRLLPDGAVDPRFGAGGFVPVGLGRGDVLLSIDRLGDSAVVLGLRLRQEANGAAHAAIARVWM
jgi:uncharacterized delta-60 repeat protein